MGKAGHLKKVMGLFEKSPVVSFSSIARIVKENSKKSEYAKQLVNILVTKGKIKRLAKGHYTLHDEIGLAVFCFTPSYLGLHSALTFHRLWNQQTLPEIITAKNARPGIRNIMGANAVVRRTKKKYLFGFEYFQDGNFYLPYSDIEKTLIDFVVFREKIDKEILMAAKKRIEPKKLEKYLRSYPKRIRERTHSLLSISVK